MEHYIKPIIIEFNGLPASGKTTVSKRLADIYRDNRFSTGTFSDIRAKFSANNRLVRLFSIIEPGNFLALINTLIFCFKIKPFAMERVTHAFGLFWFYFYYKKYITTYVKDAYPNIIIVDQGFIQKIISIVHLDKVDRINLDRLLRILMTDLSGITFVNCHIYPEQSAQRLEKRNTRRGRLDIIADRNELINSLTVQSQTFTDVRDLLQNFDHITILNIDMANEPDDNAPYIFDAVSKHVMRSN